MTHTCCALGIEKQAILIPKQPEDAGFSEFDWRCDRGVPLLV
ncbi:hypothetical protein D515_04629 [Grimontia indica]|uniref:Uncharacterized protein n=1 Tax=Grimontia indica TaxID=1056512 RepID=R1II53_9GAMM|nr:hypothetical protein D515_04629 [Grimontia indica]